MELELMEILDELKPGENFKDSKSYIDDEILDSFDVISLVSILEEKFEIVIDGLDIIPENFQNIDALIALIDKSKKA